MKNAKHAKRINTFLTRKANAKKVLAKRRNCSHAVEQLPYNELDFIINKDDKFYLKLMEEHNIYHKQHYPIKLSQYVKYGSHTCSMCKPFKLAEKHKAKVTNRKSANDAIQLGLQEYYFD